MAGQHEKMKELVAAVADSEKGRTASLSALVSEYERRMSSRPSKEEHDRLRTEVRRSCWHPYTGHLCAWSSRFMARYAPRAWHGLPTAPAPMATRSPAVHARFVAK